MSSNDKSVSDKVRQDNDTTIYNAKITGLETDVVSSNVEVKFMDSHGQHYEKFYLAYPEKQIGGGGIYITLLLALDNSFPVSLELTKYLSPEGIRYISGAMLETSDAPPDPHPAWG
ncbi:hypothetical protein Xvie_00824 [Xenorhabdus vietnamensis]|uniref:Uncharacterized protein n=1 Tax=Xenorhabdus vietnamensis TaxID=351656 RepID=A0A1Y2SGE7_9GAMM|nr:hypothetical protein [Xenorhabdus vietnamensis]OTA17440.1 hypothetical protein Xvie_00824 [Xenorhabdus vietnamensis]